MAEKRWYKRYKITASGALASGTFVCKVELLDLSAQGARIRGDLNRIKAGDEIYLSIAFKPPIKVKGIVRWSQKTKKGTEAGVQFAQMDLKTQQYLRNFLSQISLADAPDTYFR